ncbi:putative cytochrome P450, EF-hand domain pair, cytochrome P450 superfamily [Helianthus annuus]|nr:putative cytochrome P450, EF-hand domain pair, cytochrome P450 superfamily [Helianthus annuus]
MHMNRMDREDHLYTAFQYFDKDNSGYVHYYRRTRLTPHNTPDHLLCAAALPRRTTFLRRTTRYSCCTDTTTATLTWALALLVNHPVVLKIAQHELENHDGRDRKVEESDMNNLVYLQAVIKETMRLYRAAPLSVPHESTEDCIVGGLNVKIIV